MELEFEWDEDKANANFKKHGVRFEEAKSVFNDPHSLTIVDFEHSQDEARYIDFKGGVRGKHFQAYRKGHSVINPHADGTTTEEHFDMKDQNDRIPADKIPDEPQ